MLNIYIYIHHFLVAFFSFTVELVLRFSLRSCIMSACQLVMDCPFHATDKSNVACVYFLQLVYNKITILYGVDLVRKGLYWHIWSKNSYFRKPVSTSQTDSKFPKDFMLIFVFSGVFVELIHRHPQSFSFHSAVSSSSIPSYVLGQSRAHLQIKHFFMMHT